MPKFPLKLTLKFVVTPLQCSDMTICRHSNSFRVMNLIMLTENYLLVDTHHLPEENSVQFATISVRCLAVLCYRASVQCPVRRQQEWAQTIMMKLPPDQVVKLGTELSIKRQEHADIDAAIRAILSTDAIDKMVIQRFKKRKLVLKDRIVELEKIMLPDIIA